MAAFQMGPLVISCGAILLCLLFCFFSRQIGEFLKVMDRPSGNGGRKRHARATPLVGGLAVVLPTVTASLSLTSTTNSMQAIAIAGICMLIVGFLDDRAHIRPSVRLLVSFIFIILVVALSPELQLGFFVFSFLENPIFLQSTSILFTAICIIGLQNSVNMADGKNGIVLGCSLIWTLGIIYVCDAEFRSTFVIFAICLSICLFFNLKARLFIGDSGSYSISTMIGLYLIYCYNITFDRVYADMIVLWLIIPVADCLRLIVSRMVAGRSPYAPDRTHFHHYLATFTKKWWIGLVVYWSSVAVPLSLSVVFPDYTYLLIALTLTFYIVAYNFFVRRVTKARALFVGGGIQP